MTEPITNELTVAIFFSQARYRDENRYSIWQIDPFGQPVGYWTVDSTWSQSTAAVDEFTKGSWPNPQYSFTCRRREEAVREAKRAAQLGKLGVDIIDRPFQHLYGPKQHCATCNKELRTLGWEAKICTDCATIFAHGQRALGDKKAYMVGPHPGNGRSKEGSRNLYPLPELLAALAGTVLRDKRHTGDVYNPKAEDPKQAVGYKDPDQYWGGDKIVDLTPAQAKAWSAAVEWMRAELIRTERASLDEGTRLLTGLAAGKISVEDFEPQINQLRKGRSLR
jgi:hypothetical protein